MALKALESPLDCKKIQLVHPKGDQSWVFIGRTDAEAETLCTNRKESWEPSQNSINHMQVFHSWLVALGKRLSLSLRPSYFIYKVGIMIPHGVARKVK